MSNPATFWATKSIDVKSSQTPAQVANTPPVRVAPKTNGMVLKGATNGVKKSNWADSDDDEEFTASFNSLGRVKELEKTLSAKEARITEFEIAGKEKDARIIELESALERQKQGLSALQTAADASSAYVEGLKQENHKQFLHVQKLVAEVDEKDHRIAALETEVDEQCAKIAELDAEDRSTQASSQSAAPSTEPATTLAKVETEHNVAETNRDATTGEQTATEVPTTNTDAPFRPSAKTDSGKADSGKANGPAANLSAFPVFATPATVKHTAPPPPAPKLKMPVDLSKFAKKPAAKTVTPKKKIEVASTDAAKDGPVPTIDPASDIRTKRREERALFGNGPKVQVKLGDELVTTLPKYILTQTSHKAFKHFRDNPDMTTFVLPAGSMDEGAAKAHLEWMKEMTYQGRVYSVTLHSDEEFDDKNLQICRAARVLGLNNMYVGHFTKIFCDRIRSNTASWEFLNKIAALAYPENDPLYDCLANNLANLRARKASKNSAELEALLQKHTGLKARVEKIEERMRKKQEATKAPKAQSWCTLARTSRCVEADM
ncbi:hypothetical protein E8E11_000063 [Didymella keratinophila]|nr:hypothetical protein E8E11_000063 [Didymella keratinophila]